MDITELGGLFNNQINSLDAVESSKNNNESAGVSLADLNFNKYSSSSTPHLSSGSSHMLAPSIEYDPIFKLLANPMIQTEANRNVIRDHAVANQSNWKLIGSALNQAVIGEIFGGTIAGIGTLAGLPENIYGRITGSAKDWERNYLEGLGESIQEWARETTPIYTYSRHDDKLGFDSFAWWMSMTPSVASSLSILIPSGMVGKGASMLGRGVSGIARAKAINKLTKLSGGKFWDINRKLMAVNNRTNKATDAFTKVILPAASGRLIDSSREALGQFDEIYKSVLGTKDLEGIEIDENRAKEIAAQAVSKGYVYSFNNIAFDIVQWNALFKLAKGIDPNIKNAVRSKLLKDSKMGSLIDTKSVKSPFRTKGAILLEASIPEGLDEMAMDISMEEGEYDSFINNSIKTDKASTFGERLKEFVKNEKNWESFIGGFFGGLLMGGVGSIYKTSRFNKPYQDSVNKLAGELIDRATKLQEGLIKHNQLIEQGDIINAELTRSELFEQSFLESFLKGTSELDSEMLRNLANLNPKQLIEAGLLTEEELEGFNISEFRSDVNSMLDQFKDIQNIYEIETNKVYGTDNDLAIGVEIGSLKVRRKLLESVIEKYESKIEGLDKESIMINSKAEIVERYGSMAGTYFEAKSKQKQLGNQLDMYESYKKGLLEYRELERQQIETQISELERELENDNLTPAKKAYLSSKIVNLKNNTIQSETDDITSEMDATLNSIKSKIEENNKVVESTSSELDSKDIKDIDYIASTNDSLNTLLNKNETGVIAQVKGAMTTIDSRLSVLNTENGIKELYKKIKTKEELSANETAQQAILEAEREYSNFKNKDKSNLSTKELDEALDNMIKNLNGSYKSILSNSTLSKDVRDKIKERIESLIKDAKSYRDKIRKSKEDETTVTVTKYEAEIKDDEIKDEVEIENKDEVIPPITNPSLSTSPTSRPYIINNIEIKVGNLYFVEHSEGLYASNVQLEVVSIDEQKGTVQLKKGDSLITVNASQLRTYYDGSKVATYEQLIKSIKDKIDSINDRIKLDSESHTYTFTDANGRVHTNKYSPSKLYPSMFNGVSREANSAVGNMIDSFVRDYFNPEIDVNDEFYISKIAGNDKALDKDTIVKLSKALSKLQERLTREGYTIITVGNNNKDGIKVFDIESGVAGEMDIIAVNRFGDAKIIDTKSFTRKTDGTRTLLDGEFPAIDGYLKQLTIYAELVSKQYGFTVSSIEILPFEITKDITAQFKTIEPFIPTPEDLETISKRNGDRNIASNSSTIQFKFDRTTLNTDSIVPGKTIEEVINGKSEVQQIRESNTELSEDDFHNQQILIVNELTSLKERLEDTTIENKEWIIRSIDQLINDLTEYVFYEVNEDGQISTSVKLNNIFDILSKDLIFDGQDSLSKLIAFRLGDEDVNNQLSAVKIGDKSAKVAIMELALNLDRHIEYNLNKGVSENIINQSNDISILTNKDKFLEARKSKIVSIIQNNIMSGITLSPFDQQIIYSHLLGELSILQSTLEHDVDATLDLSDIAKLIKFSYNDIIGASELTEIVNTMVPILKSIREFNTGAIGNVIRSQQRRFNSTTNAKYNSKDSTFYNEQGEPLEWDADLKEQFDLYRRSDNRIIIPHEKIKESDIESAVERAFSETYSMEDGFDIAVNNEGITEFDKSGNTSIETKTIYDVLESIKKGDKMTLVVQENGDVHVFDNSHKILVGKLVNPTTQNNNYLSIKDGKLVNVITNSIETSEFKDLESTTSEDTPDSVESGLELLYRIYKNSLKSKASNISSTNKAMSKSHIVKDIAEITNGTSHASNKIRAILDVLNGNSNNKEYRDGYENITPELKYSESNIMTLIESMFGVIKYDKIDRYKPTLSKSISNIRLSDGIKSNQLSLYNTIVQNKDGKGRLEATINDISTPSVNTLAGSGNKRPDLKSTIKPSNVNGKHGIHIISINKQGQIIDAGTGSPIKGIDIKVSGKESFYVLIDAPMGKKIAFPLRANTIGDSYGNISENGTTMSYTDKAIEYVTNSLMKLAMITSTVQSASGESGERFVSDSITSELHNLKDDDVDAYMNKLQDNLVSTMESTRLSDIIVTGDRFNYPYFSVTSKSINGKVSVEMMFTTTGKRGDKTITLHHKVLRIGDKFYYLSVEADSGSSYTDNNKTITYFRNLTNINNDKFPFQEVKPSKLKSIFEEHVPNFLRQSIRTSDSDNNAGKLKFNSGDTFIDPITDKEYSSAQDYALDTSSLYNYIGTKTRGEGMDKTILSNLDYDGTYKPKLRLDVKGISTIQEGKLEGDINPMNVLRNKENLPFKEVLDVIEDIENSLSDIEVEHVGVPEGVNKGSIINTNASLTDGKGKVVFSYSNRFISSMTNIKNRIENPILSVLHEHIHASIFKAMVSSKLSKEQKVELAKQNNLDIETIINDIEKAFITKYAIDGSNLVVGEQVKEWNTALLNKDAESMGITGKELYSIMMHYIQAVKNDVTSSNKFLESNGDNINNGLAQELYTYATNPFFMAALSNLEVVGESVKDITDGRTSFIKSILDKLMSLYNKIVEAMGIKIENKNYLKEVTTMMNNLYDNLSKDSFEVVKNEVIQEETTEQVEVKDNSNPILDALSDIETSEEDNEFGFDVLTLDSLEVTNKNSILFQALENSYESDVKDDSNKFIC